MKTMIEEIKEITKYLKINGFDNDFVRIFEKIKDSDEAKEIVEKALGKTDGYSLMPDIERLAEDISEHKFTLGLVLLLEVAVKGRQNYIDKNIPIVYYYNGLEDIKHKFDECMNLLNIAGTQCFGWEVDFFTLKRISFGRLQFDAEYKAEYEYYGKIKINKGDRILNMHIPSGSPLELDKVYESIKDAYNFFPSVRKDGVLPIILTSWVIYPQYESIINPNGNLYKFRKLFDVVGYENYPSFREPSRIFGTNDISDPDSLPQKTSLQKGLAKWFKDKKDCGFGIGFLLYDGKDILTAKK